MLRTVNYYTSDDNCCKHLVSGQAEDYLKTAASGRWVKCSELLPYPVCVDWTLTCGLGSRKRLNFEVQANELRQGALVATR